MARALEPNEFRYHDDAGRVAAKWLLGMGAMFLFSSLVTAGWGVAALVHANWLQTDDLPAMSDVAWAVAMLGLATVQGVTAILLLFDRMLGIVLGIALALLEVIAYAGVISAYPAWSIAGIALNLVIAYLLVVARPRT